MKKVKRLPVINEAESLSESVARGHISNRHDRVPGLGCSRIRVSVLKAFRYVADIMRRDTSTVLPDTPVEEVLRIIDCNDMQRVCVVDKEGYFRGLISDLRPSYSLLRAFILESGLLRLGKIPFTERGEKHRNSRTLGS